MTALAQPVLREVRLYGALGRQFGRAFRLAVATPAEAVRALRAVLPGFERAFVGPDGRQAYHVFVGRGSHRRDIGEKDVAAPLGEAEPIRLVPVITGAKRGGVLQTIMGAVLIAFDFYTEGAFGGGKLSEIGAAMILGGVIQMLSPQRKGKDDKQENLPSYAFDGPVNITEQGGPVPLAYGRVICGSTVVSQGLSTAELVVPGAYGDGNPLPWETPPWWKGGGP
jgi:predicted phage tail protein